MLSKVFSQRESLAASSNDISSLLERRHFSCGTLHEAQEFADLLLDVVKAKDVELDVKDKELHRAATVQSSERDHNKETIDCLKKALDHVTLKYAETFDRCEPCATERKRLVDSACQTDTPNRTKSMIEDLTLRILKLQNSHQVALDRLDFQMRANSDLKRLIIGSIGSGKGPSLLEMYNSALLNIGDLKKSSQEWRYLYEEMRYIVEKEISQRNGVVDMPQAMKLSQISDTAQVKDLGVCCPSCQDQETFNL
ncbi:MAG: hypothetical protein SGCHY_000011 [Lobulomycetales sp.]